MYPCHGRVWAGTLSGTVSPGGGGWGSPGTLEEAFRSTIRLCCTAGDGEEGGEGSGESPSLATGLPLREDFRRGPSDMIGEYFG